MREIVFKMERPGLVEVGQEVDVSESITPVNVNYMIEPAVAMSGLFRFTERLKSKKGIVKDIIQNDRRYYVTVKFDGDNILLMFCCLKCEQRSQCDRAWHKNATL